MKIIHVDDHPLFSESMSTLLTTNDPNISVTSLASGREALELLDSGGIEVDLILMDLDMPGITGFEMLEALEQRKLSIPVIVVSSCDDLWDIRRVIESGASGFVPKTFQPRYFLDVLKAVMEGGVYLPDDIRVAMTHLPKLKPNGKVESLMAEYNLSRKQLEVLKLMQQGHNNDEIAQMLFLSVNTIKTHVRNLFTAFGVKERFKCVLYAEKVGLLSQSRMIS